MQKWFVPVLSILVLVSCSNRHAIAVFNLQKDNRCVVVDSVELTDDLTVYDSTDRIAWFPVYYIGDATKHYNLPDIPIKAKTFKRVDTILNQAQITTAHLNIFVDTALDVTVKKIYMHDETDRDLNGHFMWHNKPTTDSVKLAKAYPVFFTNLTSRILYMGDFNAVNFTGREAMNRQGLWVTIEAPNYYAGACGTGARQLLLNPHQVMIAKVPRYKGSFKTLCRLKLYIYRQTVYSNTFADYIDERMLTDSIKKND